MALIIGGVVIATLLGLVIWLTHGSIKSEYQSASVAVDKPLEIKFSQGLLTIPSDQISIQPAAEGKWQLNQSLGGDTLQFIQDQPLVADTNYTIAFGDVRRVSGLKTEVSPISFTTESAPGIENISFDDKKPLSADASFRVALSAKNRGLRELELITTPSIPLQLDVYEDKVFEWKAKDSHLLPQGKELSIKLVDHISGDTLFDKKVKVADIPEVIKKPQETNFGQHDTAVIVFAQPIDSTSARIEFSVEGKGEWKDDKTYIFSPVGVSPNTTYSYTIPKGLRSKEGGIVEKDQTHHFSTPGVVSVVGFSPRGQELSQKQQTVRVIFNQPVNKKDAEDKVSLSRGTVQSVSWEGNTLVMRTSDFGAQQTVRITVKSGIRPVFGVISNRNFESSFTTEIPVKKLNVPMYYQQYAQSCEAASLRMALAYKGAGSPSDWSILQRFGYNPRSLDKKNNIWDDPQQQFVGDVKGNQGKGTGWGVYAEPVAAAARSYGRDATVRYGVNTSFVASNIYKGNPVILWGIWDETATQKSWKTPDGRKISGPIPMHVRLVVGVKGKESNPVGFYIHDPITGPTYWTASYMMHNVQRAGAANQAVAVQ